MAFSDLGSAIDDSFDPTFFQAEPGPEGQDDDRSYYNGPRSGHWTVTSSIGSAIDDRCPTIWGLDAGPRTAGHPGAYVKPIAGNLLRKLAKASLEKQAAEAEVEGREEHVADIEQKARQQKATPETESRPKQDVIPKGFYIPRATDTRGIKIARKGGRNEVIRAPPVPLDPHKKKVREDAEVSREPSPQPCVASEKALSIVSQVSLPKPKVIRIIGKDGQEAFVELPNLPKQISRPPSAAAEKYTPKDLQVAPKKQEKRVRVEKTKQQQYEEDRTAAAKMAAKAMMSGALPVPQTQKQARQASAQVVKAHEMRADSHKSSTKGSAVDFGGLFETAATVASARSSTAASAKSLQAAVESISKNSRGPGTSRNSLHTVEGWMQETAVKSDWHKTSSSAHSKPSSSAGSKSNSHTPEHSMAGFEGSKSLSAYAASLNSQERPPSGMHLRNGSRQSTKPNDGHSPTVFAGRGWISPHPLSRSPSAVASPPQSHISLPKDDFIGGATMSYDDWKAMQQAASAPRRNLSRAESVVSSRVKAVAASIAKSGGSQMSIRESRVGSQTYHKATAESEHGWDALPQFDGPSEDSFTPNEEAAAGYERQLEEIIAQYSPHSAYQTQQAAGAETPQQEVQLDMPWDRVGGSSSSVRTPSSTQQSVAEYTPPSAANYSSACSESASEAYRRAYPRKGRSPPMDAPTPMRLHDTSAIERSANGDEGDPLVPSAYSSVVTSGLRKLERAERGYGGY